MQVLDPEALAVPVSVITRAGGAAAADARLNRDAVILSIVILVLLTAIVVILVWSVNRKRKGFLERQRDLYRAGKETVSVADAVGAQIAASPRKLSKNVRRDLDQAAELRTRASTTLDRGGTDEQLVQGNRDAAEAVVLLASLRRKAGIDTPAPPARCFYCAREDGQFLERTIGNESGAGLAVYICTDCERKLAGGETPHLTVAPYYGTQVPWWAVPNNLWYVAYGGEAWQYWLPLVTGQTLQAWFAGGWAQGVAAETTAVP